MSWLLVFVGFCLLIVLHEGGHYLAAKATGMRVESFFLFFGPRIWSFKRGETEYGVKSIPLGGYVKINGMNPEEEMPPGEEHRAYYKQKVWKRIVVVAAGPAVNIVLAFLILFFVFKVGGQEDVKPIVGETRKELPAAGVLQHGDRVVAVDGRRFASLPGAEQIERFGDQIESHACAGEPRDGCRAKSPVRVTVLRNGHERTFSLRPSYDAKEEGMKIGVAWGGNGEWVPISTGHALDRATGAMWEVVSRTASVFGRIFESEQRKEISSVVGVSDVGHQAVDAGWRQALFLLALVSLSLGVINLLPILPLDGGHIFWALIEKLRGRPVSLVTMERASIIGFVLVMMIFVIGLSNDIGKITGEGFNVSR